MREPETLPDDPEDWPRDPTSLLGLTRAADEATIRRAYLKLIRKFKPDSYPVQFQLIRQAYEQLLRIAASRETCELPTEPPAGPVAAAAPAQPTRRAEDEDQAAEIRPAAAGHWRKLIQAGARKQLRELIEIRLSGGTGELESLLVGYLLRLVDPADQSPSQISSEQLLREILRRSPELGLNLLSERLRAQPDVAGDHQFNDYLDQLVSPSQKIDLLCLKWGCLQVEDWRQVLDDFESQRQWFLDFPQGWAVLGAEALKFAGWHPQNREASDFVDCFQDELRNLAYHQQEQALLTWDDLRDTQTELLGRQNSIAGFSWRLIPHAYSRHLWLMASDLVPLWRAAQERPLGLVEQLNIQANTFPRSVAAVRGLIRRMYQATVTELAPESEQGEAVCKFLNQQGNASFPALRPALLRFCAAHGIDLMRFAYLADSRLAPHLPQPIFGDENHPDWRTLCRRDAGLDCVSMLLQLPLAPAVN